MRLRVALMMACAAAYQLPGLVSRPALAARSLCMAETEIEKVRPRTQAPLRPSRALAIRGAYCCPRR